MLEEPRAGGLRVSAADASTFATLDNLIRAHSKSEYIYAADECPEVYFLSGFRDPVAMLPERGYDSDHNAQRVLDVIHRHAINVVVLNLAAPFSGPVRPALKAEIEQEFLNGAQVGQFEVRWKE